MNSSAKIKVCFAVFYLWMTLGQSSAETIPPEDIRVKTDVYPVAVESLPVGTYDYDVSWQGIPVAVAQVKVRKYEIGGKEYYYAEAAVRTARTISWAYKLRHISESLFETKTFRPLSFYSHDIERRKQRYRKITFQGDGLVRSEYWHNGELRQHYEFDPQNFMFDPISAAFMARSVELELGKEISIDVFNAKERYLITFKVAALESIRANGKDRLAYKVVPTVRKLMNPNSKRRLKSATLWIAADETRDVLKLQSQVWIGSINATIEGFTPGKPEAEPLTPLQVKHHTQRLNQNIFR